MRRNRFTVVVAAAALVTSAACGFGGGAPETEPAEPELLPGIGAAPELRRDPDHRYRVVNLHQFSGQPGGAVDIFPAVSSELTTLEAEPVVTGLGYGEVTDPIEPGGIPSPGGSTRYGLGVLPHAPDEAGSANLKMDINDTGSARPWRHAVVVLGGTGNGLQSQTFFDSTGPDEPNAVPAAQPGKLSLMIDTQQAGDPNGPRPVDGFWVAGTAGGCLKATDDTTARAATAFNVPTTGVFVALDPDTTALGFWRVPSYDVAASACSGAPAFSVNLPALAAGSRAALFVYGLDAESLAGVVVPFDA